LLKEAAVDRVSVSSSNVDSVGYDVFTAILEVKFNNGSVYWYFGVPPDIAEALINAGSVGEFLAAHIKGCFDYECKQETTSGSFTERPA
jgi:hypothetical protein